LPAGPLRESKSRLRGCQYIVINQGFSEGNGVVVPRDLTQDPANIAAMVLKQLALVNIKTAERRDLHTFIGTCVHAIAGIGHPERFFSALENAGVEIIRHPYPDHHAFVESELHFGDDLPVIMTEKDAVKLSGGRLTNLWYLPIVASLPELFVNKFVVDVKSLIGSVDLNAASSNETERNTY
jgi:tetraacyldisaccharide 4'-kinase